jgi:cytochrome c biogenesis protein
MGSAGKTNPIWKFFTSQRLTVVVLLTLAMTSVIGTLLPQNEEPAAYRQAFGETGYRLLSFLDLFDMYHSLWFQLLLLLLTINIVACSIHRLSSLWKIIFTREPKFILDSFRSMGNRLEFDVPQRSEIMVPAVEAYLSKHFGYRVQQNSESGFVFFAEKWKWSRLGVYIVHLSIVLLLIGAIIGSILGFEGYVNIAEGESTATIQLMKGGKSLELPFSIRCNDFEVSFYESGMPKEFRSNLTILEGNEPVLTRDILVNHPLRFRGINFFQSGYGEMPPSEQIHSSPESVTLGFTSKGTSKSYSLKANIGQTLQIPEDLGILQLREWVPGFNYRGNDLGPTLVATLIQKDGTQADIILPVNYPTFDRMMQRMNPGRSDAVLISIVDIQSGISAKRFYTGLQVTKDPGVGVVYTGFILLLAGCAVAFFLSHQQVCIEISPLKDKTRIAISGKTNKFKPGMKRKVEEIRGKLESIAKMSAEKDTQ